MTRRVPTKVPVVPSAPALMDTDLDVAISRLKRRLEEITAIGDSFSDPDDDRIDNAERNIVADLRDVFGAGSVEFQNHEHYRIWKGPMRVGMSPHERLAGTKGGIDATKTLLTSLIARLEERRSERTANPQVRVKEAFDRLDLHTRVGGACADQFRAGHYREAVLNAGIALVNFVKEKAGRHDIDGTTLMTTVFSPKNPTLAFNALVDQTDTDEQQGFMYLFMGAVQALRNPRAHALKPDSPEEAAEAIAFLSFLATRLEGAKRVSPKP